MSNPIFVAGRHGQGGRGFGAGLRRALSEHGAVVLVLDFDEDLV